MYSDLNQDSSDLCEECREVRERLRIDIARVFQDLDPRGSLDEHKRRIICKSLRGDTPTEIAESTDFFYNANAIRQILGNSIYPRMRDLLNVNQEIAGNWARIINCLLDLGYRLGEPCLIPSVNTLMSFGNYVFLRRRTPTISRLQLSAARNYSEGDYYLALSQFLKAWRREKEIEGNGNSETLIYISNCLIEHNKEALRNRGIKKYTLAVVVPIEHNLGEVAAELLCGVAQMQLKINVGNLLSHQVDVNGCRWLQEVIGINSGDFFDDYNFKKKIVLRVLIVDESQSLQYDGIVNQAAEDLARRADELEIVAVLGHYASEMTKSAIQVYTRPNTGLFLITPSSTSDDLSDLDEGFSFFRMTTQDQLATKCLANYLTRQSTSPQKVAIIYNQNSSYCRSFKTAILQHLKEDKEKFRLLPECGNLSNGYFQSIEPYLSEISVQGVTTLIVIADGGIEPRSLNDAQAISQFFNMNSCLVACSATFYHDTVLDWIKQKEQHRSLDKNKASNLVISVPWHHKSLRNSNNPVAVNFCRLGNILWGEGKLTWRSATAYDAVLTVVNHLPINGTKESAQGRNFVRERIILRDSINNTLRGVSQVGINGVTGEISFDDNGNRINPPVEIVTDRWNDERQEYEFIPVELLKA